MKTVIITGIGKGIGKALAQKFLAEGDFVIGTYLSNPPDFSHENLTVFTLDLRDNKSIEKCVADIKNFNKKIDILINNAGVLLDEEETRVVLEKLRQTLEVNLIGTINFTEKLVPLMSKNSHIVNISSSAGSYELARKAVSHYPYHYPSYKIVKAALNMYTITLALSLRDKDIIVSAVHPGWVKTEMGGPEADLTPEEAAKSIYKFAISKPETGQFWFNGEKFPF